MCLHLASSGQAPAFMGQPVPRKKFPTYVGQMKATSSFKGEFDVCNGRLYLKSKLCYDSVIGL